LNAFGIIRPALWCLRMMAGPYPVKTVAETPYLLLTRKHLRMKKILLFFAGIACASLSHGQLILNEFYVKPDSKQGNQEFLELKNNGPVVENTACYSVITYFKTKQDERGFYKIDLPSMNVDPGAYLTMSTSAPSFQFPGNTGNADFSWNAGNIHRYVFSNGTLVEDNTGSAYYDVFTKSSGSGNGNGGVYAVFLFKGSLLMDAFIGSGISMLVPDFITELGQLSTGGSCGFSYDFASINNEEDSLFANVAPSNGSESGFYRVADGCGSDGSWIESSGINEHTPGLANAAGRGNNGNGGPIEPLEVNTECVNDTTITYDIVAGSKKLYPVNVYVYYDANGSQFLDEGDVLIGSFRENNTNASARFIDHASGQEDFIFVFDAKGSCNDLVIPLNCPAAIVLPVTLQSFTAQRSGGNVVLNWTTATEINNRGFNVQRLQGNGQWQTITFIPSAAAGGNSTSVQQYSYTDHNLFNGVTQYRLQQVDQDGRFRYSDIRSVRSEGQNTRVLLYPNPSFGTANLQFANANSVRDVLVTDMAGRVVRQWRSVTTQNLQLSGLTPGVYSVKVIDQRDGSQDIERLVVNGR
jgi:hypothetical protein